MNFADAIEVLKNGSPDQKKDAFVAVRSEIVNSSSVSLHEAVQCSHLNMVLAKLANELLNSTNPAFSYQILSALRESLIFGKNEIENDSAIRGLFINEQLGSKTVENGLWKCMVALGNCTKVYED